MCKMGMGGIEDVWHLFFVNKGKLSAEHILKSVGKDSESRERKIHISNQLNNCLTHQVTMSRNSTNVYLNLLV